MSDVIERSITINAPLERVWGLVTEPGWWVPNDASPSPTGGAGDVIVRESRQHGRFPIEIVDLRPHSYAAFRWASAFAGQDLAPGRTTLVEFTLTPDDGGQVLVAVRESGFASLEGTDELRRQNFEGNTDGWRQELAKLQLRSEGGTT